MAKKAVRKNAKVDAADLENKLKELLKGGGSVDACLEFFADLNENTRRALAPFCLKWWRQQAKVAAEQDEEKSAARSASTYAESCCFGWARTKAKFAFRRHRSTPVLLRRPNPTT